jgi:hypothetical protein
MTGLQHLEVVLFPSSRLCYTNSIRQRNVSSFQTNILLQKEQILTQRQRAFQSSITPSKGNGSSIQEKLHMAQ